MALFDSITQANEARKKTTRRRFLIGGGAMLFSYIGFRWWRFRARPVANRETRFISTNREFYSVAIKDLFSPDPNPDQWNLEIVGLDGKSFFISYDELQALGKRQVFKTFICVGNEIGGPLINNAEWTVTPLAPLLIKALGDSSRKNLRVVFTALDDFYSSVPIEVALSDLANIAYEMNGEKLPLAHGFPARIFLPGKYGMKQPRWLKKIEITKAPLLKGYYEVRGFSDDGSIKIQARIDSALRQKNDEWLVQGIALCGARSVGQVEVSFDEEKTWQTAKITSDKFPDAWVTWEIPWAPKRKGEYLLTARVIDDAGNRQIENNGTSFPSGSSGLHRVTVVV